MTAKEPEETAAWLASVFRDISDDQAGVWCEQFKDDVYRRDDVRKAASILRPLVAFFDPVRFAAICNRIRLQRLTPEERQRIASEATAKALREQASNPTRLEHERIAKRKAEIQARIRELGQEQRATLAQQAINRLPEDLRSLYDAMAAMKRDPFEIASIREVAGEILGAA